MQIAQLTDCHVVAEGKLAYGRIPTNDQLREAVAHMNALDPLPDAVVGSGDLVDHGREEEYEALRAILSELVPPVYLIPGNHDDRAGLLRAFADQGYLPEPGSPFAHWAVDLSPVRLIGVDTHVSGHHHGELCEERLSWLDRTLGSEPERPTAIFMHHPPFRTGIRWMDSSGLLGGRRMAELVSQHPQVDLVACGHLHRPIQLAWAGTVACTAPSTCHQVALNLSGKGGFEFVMEPRAVQLHSWDPDHGFISHTSYVGTGEAPFPAFRSVADLPDEQVEALIRQGLAKLAPEFGDP